VQFRVARAEVRGDTGKDLAEEALDATAVNRMTSMIPLRQMPKEL